MSTHESVRALAHALVDQEKARIIVPAERPEAGYWFGGGNVTPGPDGALYVAGRYRSRGDSRTGLGEGERGKELAVFRSNDGGESFVKILSFSKARLESATGPVLSIEGSHLLVHDRGITLYLSTEKDRPYPEELAGYRKPGTGVWSIDRMDAPTLEALADAEVHPFIVSPDPEHLHVKDPFAVVLGGVTYVGYCTHPFTWASSNTAFCIEEGRTAGARVADWKDQRLNVFPRGPVWDVAVTRVTCYAPIAGRILVFYDGAECMRRLDAHHTSVSRPRGYSCEEIGGLAVARLESPLTPERVSTWGAEFISPRGTGCSRYVDVCFTETRAYATWQQSQADESQPLVMNRLPREDVERFLR